MLDASAALEKQKYFCNYKQTLEKKKELILELSFSVDAKQRRCDVSWARKGEGMLSLWTAAWGTPIKKTKQPSNMNTEEVSN